MRALTLTVFIIVWSADVIAAKPFGSVAAPATLEAGELAVYGFVGAPALGAGFRQGLGGIELSGFLEADTLRLAALAEGLLKMPVFRKEKWLVAAGAGAGVIANSGAQYFDAANTAYWGLRARLQGLASYAFADTASAVMQLDVPFTFSMPSVEAFQATTLLGGGAEWYIGDGASALVLAQAGVDIVRTLETTVVRPAWQIKLGVGWRLF